MKTNQNSTTLSLGAAVEKLFGQGSAVADLALELTPASSPRRRRLDTPSPLSARAA